MQFPIVIFGAISAVTLGGAGLFLLDKPKQDLGGGAPTSIQAAGSGPKHDILGPVGAREATRRANATGEEAVAAAARGSTFVAQPVIAEAKPTPKPEVVDDEFTRKAQVTSLGPTTTATPPPAAPPARVADGMPPERVVEKIVYVQAPLPAAVPTPSPQTMQRINSQIEALLSPAQGGFVVQR